MLLPLVLVVVAVASLLVSPLLGFVNFGSRSAGKTTDDEFAY